MSIQKVSNPIANRTIILSGKAQDDNPTAGEWLTAYIIENPYANTKASNKVKTGVFLSTLAGVAAAMALVFKHKGMPIKPQSLWKITYKENEIPALVGALAVGSIGGGLIGGAILDKKENLKAKLREAIIQGVGNIATPLGCVWGGMKLFKKYLEPQILKKTKFTGKMAEVPKIIASAISLVSGIFLGNKIGNTINKKAFKCEEKRTLKLSDMSPHIDDLGLATSFVVPPTSSIGHIITRIIPAALMIAGISTGVAQEKHKPTVKTVMFRKSEVSKS